jgi:hypothetical protein
LAVPQQHNPWIAPFAFKLWKVGKNIPGKYSLFYISVATRIIPTKEQFEDRGPFC